MKLFLKKSVLFLPVLLTAYLLCMFIFSITPLKKIIPTIKMNIGGSGHSLLRFREIQHIKNPDILFIGSSHASKGFDNRLFTEQDLTTFNLGSGLQTPQNTYYLLKEYIPSVQPKQIIMELFWEAVEYENGSEACIDITSNTPLSKEIIKMNLSTKEFKVINSMISIYLSRIITPLKDCFQQQIKGETYIPGGSLESVHNENYARKSVASISLRKVNLPKKQLDYLRLINEYCKVQAVPILFVTAPVPQELLERTSNYAEIVDTLSGIIRTYNNRWINFNDELYRKPLQLITITDFDDANHLSKEGVKKFNRALIKMLTTNK